MPDFRPLYAQVQATLIDRLAEGIWAPGQALPAETALAKEMGVSQGTVRKAVDRLCADGVLTRAQGRGTFVAEQTLELANFRFFRIVDSQGKRVVPDLVRQIAVSREADPTEAKALSIPVGSEVHVMDRIRTISGQRAVLERATVPDVIMPGLSQSAPPNALYPHYQAHYGVTVISAEDRLSAIPADDRQARRLGVLSGAPLLHVVRVARDLRDRPVEYRLSWFVTQGTSFAVTLSQTAQTID